MISKQELAKNSSEECPPFEVIGLLQIKNNRDMSPNVDPMDGRGSSYSRGGRDGVRNRGWGRRRLRGWESFGSSGGVGAHGDEGDSGDLPL